MVGAVITAVVAIASAIQQSEAQRVAAKQSEYDAEFERAQAEAMAEQEQFNREAARRIETRESEAAKRERIAMLVRSGGGLGVAAVQELSRQATLDELNIMNADLSSSVRRQQMRRAGQAAFVSGRAQAQNYRTQSRWSLGAGIGTAAGSVASGWKAEQRHQQSLKMGARR